MSSSSYSTAPQPDKGESQHVPEVKSNNNSNSNDDNPSSSETSTSTSTPQLALPDASSDNTQKLDVSGQGGSTVTLDHLGPIVVNQDGTMSRISNWHQMTEAEQKNTLRVLGKRNQQRLRALRDAGVEGSP